VLVAVCHRERNGAHLIHARLVAATLVRCRCGAGNEKADAVPVGVMESTLVTDDVAVERVRAVYESDHDRLWRSLYAFTGSRPIADDASAEAFAQALRRGSEVRDVAAWVWRSAYAIARGELQRRSLTSAVAADAIVAEVAATGEHDELVAVLNQLRPLSHEDRELLVLCHVAGWKPRELAPVLGISASTLRVRLHRATRRARELMTPFVAQAVIDEEEQ
jgi:RNA polymerase sigma-70 factor, ECF subfamily